MAYRWQCSSVVVASGDFTAPIGQLVRTIPGGAGLGQALVPHATRHHDGGATTTRLGAASRAAAKGEVPAAPSRDQAGAGTEGGSSPGAGAPGAMDLTERGADGSGVVPMMADERMRVQ